MTWGETANTNVRNIWKTIKTKMIEYVRNLPSLRETNSLMVEEIKEAMKKTFDQIAIGSTYYRKGNIYLTKMSNKESDSVINWLLTISEFPLSPVSTTMEQYYLNLATRGQFDVDRNGTKIFQIGEGDTFMFPELRDVFELWILPSGKVQQIAVKTVCDYYQSINFFEPERRINK